LRWPSYPRSANSSSKPCHAIWRWALRIIPGHFPDQIGDMPGGFGAQFGCSRRWEPVMVQQAVWASAEEIAEQTSAIQASAGRCL